MIAFIDDHREAHGVEPICKVLPIAPSTYHAHVAKRADPAKLSVRASGMQAAVRIAFERLLHQKRQAIEALAHVRVPAANQTRTPLGIGIIADAWPSPAP